MIKKKTIIIILSSLVLLVTCAHYGTSYSSNSLDKYVKTIEEDGVAHSSTGIDSAELFLPSQTFFSDYKYKSGTYNYKDYGLVKGLELSILVLEYSDTIYIDAKNYCNSHMDLSLTNTFEFNNYYFLENMAHPKRYSNIDENGNNDSFPSFFTMYCYNDIKNTLIFLGFSAQLNKKEKTKILEDWGYFLNKYYINYYNFND